MSLNYYANITLLCCLLSMILQKELTATIATIPPVVTSVDSMAGSVLKKLDIANAPWIQKRIHRK